MISLIESACNIDNENQAYAINVLTNIIKEYPDHEKGIGHALTSEF
jgi:hypothetical protein